MVLTHCSKTQDTGVAKPSLTQPAFAFPFAEMASILDGELLHIMEDTLGLYYWDGFSWVLEPTSLVDLDTNTLTATPDHFSVWAVLGEPFQFRFLPLMHRK